MSQISEDSESTSSASTGSMSTSSTSSSSEYIYDPVETHLIHLQEYYREVNNLSLAKKLNKLQEGKLDKNSIVFTPDNIPDYPEFVPVCPSRPRIASNCPDKDELNEELQIFVERVFAMCGCVVSDEDSEFIIGLLAAALNIFLESFVKHMSMVKDSENFSGSDELMNPLETTLQQIGFGGIAGLHAFYEENVVKEHAYLKEECLKLRSIVQKIQSILSRDQ